MRTPRLVYRCRDCGHDRRPQMRELSRAATLRCMECGGMLDPVGKTTHAKLEAFAERKAERGEGGRL